MCHRRARAGGATPRPAIGSVSASPEIFSIWTMAGPAKPDLVLEGPGVRNQAVGWVERLRNPSAKGAGGDGFRHRVRPMAGPGGSTHPTGPFFGSARLVPASPP